MAAFSNRHPGYKVGVILLFLTTLLFLVANFVPMWIRYSRTEHDLPIPNGTIYYKQDDDFSSVLSGCSKEFKNGTRWNMNSPVAFSGNTLSCGTGYFDDSTTGGWVHACQAFEVIGVIALLFACIYAIRTNFCKASLGPRTRYMETAVVIAGLLGLLGTLIFVGKLASTVRDSQFHSFSWSLYLAVVVSILVTAVGALIAIFNRPTSEVYKPLGGDRIS